ncbi:AAA domain-containing protein [Longispora albida]|uniref:AAA domain-containing protein n=1 Tax=Longispora albida TaxID=203523 RepID=UPI0003A6CE86|nr:AAA domain-containing protein [Longispora albida]
MLDEILADVLSGKHRGVVVDSPPGAGKSTLVVAAALRLPGRLMIVAQTNEQVDDLIERLAAKDPEVTIGRLSAGGYQAAERIKLPNVTVAPKVAGLGEPRVTIATAAKWGTLTEGEWPWAIVDEAYQMRSDALLRIAGRFERALFVGDPGQLDPFSTVDGERWSGLSWDPLQSAVSVLLRHNPDLPVHRLPVSWRLPASAAPLVSAAFYPFTGFTSGTGPGDRRLELGEGDGRAEDQAIEMAAAGGWALYELPGKHVVRTDAEAVSAVASLAERLLSRGIVAHDEKGTSPVTADRVAIGAAHRDQVAAIRAALGDLPVTVDTANRLQGREYEITIVLHPLSGRRDATAFHLESGRLCVLASRHRHACIVVARAGIAELLDAHPSTEPVPLGVPVAFPDGWAAHQAVLAHLSEFRVPAAGA